MKSKLNIFFLLGFAIISLLFCFACSSSISNISLRKDYDFQNKKSVTVYVDPADKQDFNETYARVLYLDLKARGYDVVNANLLLNENADRVSGKTLRELADSLSSKKYIPKSDLIAVVKTNWDSTLVLTYYSESRTAIWKYYRFAGLHAKKLTAQLAFFDRSIREPILSFTASDTAYLYAEDDNSKLIYSEFPWMIAAKQISKQLREIPLCQVNNPVPAKNQFKLSLWVDKSYRKEFPDTWKDRLVLRVLYANDILHSQFDIELVIKEFVEWDSEFDDDLKKTLANLSRAGTSQQEFLRIGVTLNKELKTNWKNRDHIGLAYLFNSYIAVTAQPSFPAVGQYWNPIEEAITLVHEVGHALGAIHSDDNSSIMYPTSGTLAYEFDQINRTIIETTKSTFFNPDKKQKVTGYLHVLNDLRKSQNGNILILDAATSALSDILQSDSYDKEKTRRLTSLLMSVSPDSAFAYATEGYIEFKKSRFKQAKKNFIKAIDLDPGFAEVNKYLALIPENIRIEEEKKDKENTESKPKTSAAAKKK